MDDHAVNNTPEKTSKVGHPIDGVIGKVFVSFNKYVRTVKSDNTTTPPKEEQNEQKPE